MRWDAAFEAACDRLVREVCDDTGARAVRERAWHGLLGRIGPEIEAWARRSPVLRQAGLATDDDARAVLVAVLERLAASDFANLRLFVERRPPPVGVGDVIDELARLGDDEAVDGVVAARAGGAAAATEGHRELDEILAAGGDSTPVPTPLRAWLRTLTRYLERDHVRQRLGAGTVRDKRGVTTDTEALPTSGIAGARPPITDTLAMAAAVAEIRAYMATFPAPMRQALERWLDDAGFDEIAAELSLPDPARARALVRAAQARLRERFRDRMPAVFGVA